MQENKKGFTLAFGPSTDLEHYCSSYGISCAAKIMGDGWVMDY